MKNTMKYIQLTEGSELHQVEACCIICGKDINISFGGGDTFHIGASALAVPRPSLENKSITSASASVICVTGHKEDELARSAALRFAAKFNARVNVTCGLHIDNASKDDIHLLYKNFVQLLDLVETKLADCLSS